MSTITETVDLTALTEIEEKVVTSVHLADLIRRGSQNTDQAYGWGQGGEACALSAGALECQRMGFIGK